MSARRADSPGSSLPEASATSSHPPRAPRKNLQGLPPTHLLHLRALLHQFLTQQTAPPDEGLPGPSNRNQVPDRPLWSPERLAEVEQAIWGVVLKNGGGGKEGLLGCDWDGWTVGARLRRQAWRREQALQEMSASAKDATVNERSENVVRGLGLRIPGAGLLPSALTSATTTPTKGHRSPSIASSSRSREHSGLSNAQEPQDTAPTPIRPGPESPDEVEEWSRQVRGLKGFLALNDSQKEGWEVLDEPPPQRAPVREIPGAFPQAYSSYANSVYSAQSLVSLSSSPRGATPAQPLPPLLKPIICLSFTSPPPAYTFGSARSQSTLRSGREGSAGPEGGSSRTRHGSFSAGAAVGTGSGGLGALGGWFGNKWSEMTVAAEDGKVEMEFVPGRFALLRGQEGLVRRRSSTIRRRAKGVMTGHNDDNDSNDGDDSGTDNDETVDSHESTWSGTERGHGRKSDKDSSENVVVAGSGLDIPVAAAGRGEVGVVGGTIVIRGVKREEERRGLEKVFEAIIYTIQSHTFELSLLDAFSIPREPDPVQPPRIPPKPEGKRSRTTIDVPRPSSPNLGRANSHGSGGRRGFFAKLGLGSSEGGGKGVKRGMWDGLLGKRRVSQIAQVEEPGVSEDEIDDLILHRKPSVARGRLPVIPQSHEVSPCYTPPPTYPTHPMGGIDRHLHLLAHIGGMLHSTTPGLVFPLPPILLRVHDEDRIRREKAGEEIKVENGGSGSGAATPQPQWTNAIAGPRLRAGTISAWRTGSALSNVTAGSLASTGTGIDGLPSGQPLAVPPRVEEVRGRALGYRLGGDIRSGLASLAGNLEGWDGWCRLQRIEYVFWIGVEEVLGDQVEVGERTVLACTKPLGSVHRYYDPSSDMSIEDYLSELADDLGITGEVGVGADEGEAHASGLKLVDREDESQKAKEDNTDSHTLDESGSWEPVCGRPGCGVAERDHLRIWATGGRRVVGKVVKTPRADQGSSGEGGPLGKRAQVQCDSCGSKSAWQELGIVQAMSWNKLLELMFYSSLLIPQSLCPHASQATSPGSLQNFTYVLSNPILTLRLTSEPQPVLDTRLPKLQIGPLVAKRKLGNEAARAASESFALVAPRDGGSEGKVQIAEGVVKAWKDDVETLVGKLAEIAGSADTTLDCVKADLEAIVKELLLPDLAGAPQRQALVQVKVDNVQQRLDAWRLAHKPEIPKADMLIPAIPGLAGGKEKGMKLPGSSVVVRDDEPASVIAYTLSSLAYFNELCNGSVKPSSNDVFPNNTLAQTPENQWKTEVSRRDNPREILPLRALTKKRSEMSLPPTGRLPLSVTPNAPSLELNLQPVSGQSGGRDGGGGIDDLVKSISRAAGKDPVLTTSINPMFTPSVILPRPNTEQTPTSLAVPPSASSLSLSESEISVDEKRQTPRTRRRLADDGPPSSYRRTVSASVSVNVSPRSTPTPTIGTRTPPRSSRNKENLGAALPSPAAAATSSFAGHERYASTDKEGWGGSVTSTFTSHFNSLLRLGTDVTDSLASRVRSGPGDPPRSLASIMNPLNLSSADPTLNPDDARPHIHLELSHPKYKIGCTVYFASAFDTLRRRCAFDRSFVRSLERSVGWMAEGGKSKANFWKTEDGRLVVKSLVTKWNVSDLQALIDIAPAYFEHMATTHNKATALAKIVGFYNVKIHDINTNEKRSMDLLVMENLFWKQEIDRTFDLKGIGRRVPKGKESGSTMFDGEWLDRQATSPLFVHPHAKRILLDSLTTDTRFLSNQHIVDYSLLLGLDRTHSELVVGVVDAVGSYGLFKNIESMGKIALARGREGEVTIIPPEQYRERFETALRSYFITCPDKWSRSANRTGTCPTDLPLLF